MTSGLENVSYEFITSTQQLIDITPNLENSPTVSVDTEGNNLDPYQAKLLLLQLATPEKSFVIDCTKVDLGPIKPVLEAEKPLKILQNAKFDYSLLKVQRGITLGSIYDTMIAERLITCGLSREISLKTIAEKYLGLKLEKVTRESFTDPKNPALRGKFSKEQLDYAARDAYILLEIFKKQLKQLKEQDLIDVAKLEFKVVSVVAEMELKGSLIDIQKWRTHIKELEEKRNEISREIQKELRPLANFTQVDLFGNESDTVNLDSPLQLLEAFKKLGVELPNTSEATLQKCDHPLAKILLEYRGYEKMITAFGETILEKINPITGRLHPDFLQLGADTGRFACNNPNLQQIPADSGFRSCFVASPGYKLITADYSQVELRIMAEVSEDPVFLEAFRTDQDLHTLTASQMFRIPIDKVDKNKRFQAKSINFGLMYGRGPASLAVQIGVSVDEARELLDVYFKTYRSVKRWLDNIGRSAVKNGYVRTLGGRKRAFTLPDKDHVDYLKLIGGIERQGKNTPIQGTSADITKYALVFIYEEFKKRSLDAYLIHTVHDEIVSEAREDIAEEVARIIEGQMIRAGELLLKKCPVKVEVKVSDYWEK
jgi:DNA polymerase I-like protein with 3'-5' exonuclease and polymerase domains